MPMQVPLERLERGRILFFMARGAIYAFATIYYRSDYWQRCKAWLTLWCRHLYKTLAVHMKVPLQGLERDRNASGIEQRHIVPMC